MLHPCLKPLTLALAGALLLSACAVTEVSAPAPAKAPEQFKEALPAQAGASTAVPDAWWQMFQDPVLDELERQVVIGNENLKIALAQVASARATLDASQSAELPTLAVGLNGTRSANVVGSSASSDPSTNVALNASSSWEIDVWGRLSMAVRSAEASAKASQADLAAAQLSAQATLAQSYFALRSAELQQALLERSVQAFQRALDLTQQRHQGGVAALSDVLQAQTQLSSTRTQLADTAAQRAQLEHAIAVLLGQAPSSFNLAPTYKLPDKVSVPHTLPAQLLQRRPDIAAAQLRVRAAYAQIGIADAAYFPSLSLSASAGYTQSSLASLFSAPNLAWSLGASLSESVFDGGARQQASAQARANASQITASYRQTVLTALQEVEDNLVLANRLSEEVQSQTEALQSSQRNLDLVMEQYRAGTVSYLNVSAAQSSALGSEISLISVRNRELAALNILLKNIAGRWDAP